MAALLSPEHIALIDSGVSVIVASRDAQLRPSLMRGMGSRISAEPSPLLTTLPTGQPMLLSRMSAPLASMAICAASAMQTGSLPKIWACIGCSPGKGASSVRLFLS